MAAGSAAPGARRPTPATVDAYCRRLGSGRESAPFLRWQCGEDEVGAVTLTTTWDDAGIAAYQEAHFGKTLLFTDHTDWAPVLWPRTVARDH